MGESVPTPEKSKCQYDDVKPGMKRSTVYGNPSVLL